jgi:hypothetical protein
MKNTKIQIRTKKWVGDVRSPLYSNLINVASGKTSSYLRVQFNFKIIFLG